jgi:hypothetical protein
MIGFRGGLKDAEIDDVRIVTASGEKIHETFDNRRMVLPFSAGILLALAAVVMCLAFLRGNGGLKAALLTTCLLGTVTAIVSGAWLAYDCLARARLPAESSAVVALDQERVGGLSPEAVERLGYPKDRITSGPIFCRTGEGCGRINDAELERVLTSEKKTFRMVFLGASQLLGCGANQLEDTIFARTHAALASRFGKVEALNASFPAVYSTLLLKLYKEKYSRFRPDLVVMNIGGNDSNDELVGFIASELAELNRKSGARTVLLEEANSRENDLGSLLKNHAAARRAGEAHGALVLGLHSFLDGPEIRDSGFLWWDYAHLTSYAQEAAAAWLAPLLIKAGSRSAKSTPAVVRSP